VVVRSEWRGLGGFFKQPISLESAAPPIKDAIPKRSRGAQQAAPLRRPPLRRFASRKCPNVKK